MYVEPVSLETELIRSHTTVLIVLTSLNTWPIISKKDSMRKFIIFYFATAEKEGRANKKVFVANINKFLPSSKM